MLPLFAPGPLSAASPPPDPAGRPGYPIKSIRLIVAYPPGGTNNLLARLIGQKLSESWGQPVVVENRPGANTVIGTEALAKSTPDGYSIMMMSGTHVVNALLRPNLPYDTIKDFAPVATIASQEYLLVVNPSVPAGTLQEFIALAKARPGQLNYGIVGTGSVTHLTTELFRFMSGTQMQAIPYKGSGPALIDLLGGQLEMLFQAPAAVLPHIKTGKIRGIAISGESRSAALPQVPTFAESGLPGFQAKNWNGILAPAGTAKDIIGKLSAEIARILSMPDSREKLLSQGMEPFISNPEQVAALIKAEMITFAKVIKSANIKIDP